MHPIYRGFIKFLLIAYVYSISSIACADIFINIPQLMRNINWMAVILEDISIISGIMLIMSSLFALKRYGQTRTFMSQNLTLTKPMMKIIAGSILLALPVMLRTVMLNFWGTSNPLTYQGSTDDWSTLIPPIIGFIRVIGVIAFIRGWLILSRSNGEQTQPGTYGKAIFHIFGGILCIHIMGTYYLLKNILAWS